MPADEEFTLCPFPDPGEACAVWRRNQLRDFKMRVKSIGLENDPEVRKILSLMMDEDARVQEMWERQRDGQSNTPWWADGEYDEAKADR